MTNLFPLLSPHPGRSVSSLPLLPHPVFHRPSRILFSFTHIILYCHCPVHPSLETLHSNYILFLPPLPPRPFTSTPPPFPPSPAWSLAAGGGVTCVLLRHVSVPFTTTPSSCMLRKIRWSNNYRVYSTFCFPIIKIWLSFILIYLLFWI